MTLLLQLLSVDLALLICQVQALHENLSCEYGPNCTKVQDKQAKCPPGYFRSEADTEASDQCLKCPVNFYNHLAGRESCFPCGSEAIQPEEGQTTCICLGEGRIFQPSDSRCPCSPGYQLADDGIKCVRIVYDICRDGSSRNHEGKCLTKQEWDDYCSNKVCANPEHYQGYDKFLGLCICRTEDLDSICNSECRRNQKYSLQFICKENTPHLISTDSSGNKVPIRTEDIRTEALISSDGAGDICSSKLSNPHSVYIVKTTEQGFWGQYNFNARDINNLLDSQYNFTLYNISGGHITYRSDKTSGILNPTTCIHVNDFIMFIASQHSFPIYDVNNLYNTNPGFDWGPFRTLAEEMWLSSKPHFSFLFQFQEPGVYVIKLSNNHYKKMYIRVMIAGGQCYEEGPFFPTAPRHVIRNGIAQAPPLLLKPDWPAIAGIITGLMLILITCIVLLVWFRDFGWTVKAITIPRFRKLHLKYNLDSYSSKGSTVTTAKKLHPRTKIKCHGDKKWEEASKQKCQKFLEDDAFWDYEQQVDMESFNSHTFYDILLKQSYLVTFKLGQLKDEVKGFYEKLVYEVSTLKETFVKQLSIIGHPNRYSSSILESYIQKKQEADLVIAKRKRMAVEYEDILKKQLRVLQEDMKSQEEHCVMFNSALRESVRLLEVMKDKTGSSVSRDTQCTIKLQRYLAQFDTSCNTMYTAVMKESNRLKLWGVLGEGTGAYLVNKDRTRLLSKRDLIALDGSLQQSDIVCADPVLGLITPTPHSVMLLSSHYLTPVPGDYFVHSDTGKVLPIAGNVGYDPATSQLISTVDSAYREIWKTNVPVLPYIIYPLSVSTGLPLDCKLPDIQQVQYQNFTVMVDPVSGLEVPVLSVTRHPITRHWLAVGGTYLHPFTNTLSPIEIGGPMIGDKGKIFPILGVGLNSSTGDVIPLGGLVSASGAVSVLGDIFCEPLSGKKARIQGAVLQQDRVMPHAGGYRSLLDSNLMMAQIAVIDALKAHRDLFSEDLPFVKEDFVQAHAVFADVLETMKKAISIRSQYMMSRVYNVTNQHKMAEDIKRYGGNLGMMKYHKTELWIPAVLGMEIPDPGPSDLMVPVLGVEHDYIKGHLIPLAGTMEDPDGRGLIPIKIGARTINPITGSRCTVVGIQTSPVTGIITPVMQLVGPLKDKDSFLLEALHNELVMREKFWLSQQTKEEELIKDLNAIAFYVLDAAREGKTHKIRLKERIESIHESCQSFEEDSLREVQRKACSKLNSLIIKMSHLPILEGSTEEKEQQLIFSLVIKKTTEKIMEFTKKIEQESERQISQLREWMKSREQAGEAVIKARQTSVMVNYIDEFEDHIMKRLSGVDSAYCRLEYVKEQNKMQGLLTKSHLLGTSPHYTSPQRSYWDVARKDHRHIGQMLIPMLKHLTEFVEGSKKSTPLPEEQPGSGYSSRSTLKASAANSDKLQVLSSAAKKPKHTTNFHMFNSRKIVQRHQGYLLRFLTEKQASELVHLECILLSEEMNRIWNFYELYNVKTNSSALTPQDIDKQHLKNDAEINKNVEWGKMVEELTEVHRTALTALYEKHQEEVKTMGLNPNTAIPENYFNRDVKAAILQLAMDILTTYQQLLCDNSQGMSSTESKLFTDNKDSQIVLLQTIAAKFVRQELLIQIHMYNILDTYTEIQMSNCAEEVQKTMSKLQYKSYSGKAAAEEAADIMKKQYIERLICFLKKSYNEKQNQLPLAEMKSQLKEEHCALTEKLLQEKDTLSLQRMAKCSETKCNMDFAICFMLCQRHLRQTVILLQECFKAQKQDQEKLFKNLHDTINTIHCQEDLSHLLNNKTEVRYLFTDLQNVLKRIQLREHHLKELSSKLKEYCSDKVHILSCLEEMNCLEYELQAFVEQQLKRLKEELKALSESSQFNEQCKTVASEQKGDISLNEQELCKQAKQAQVEHAHRKQILDERLKLQDQLERGELNDLMKEKLVKEHDGTIAFLEKALQQNLEMVDIKLEKEIMINQKPAESSHPDPDIPHGKPNLQNSDQKILTLLLDNISIFQQAEQIAAARTALLVPHMYNSIFPEDGNSSKRQESSLLLTLLKEVDNQLKANVQSTKLAGANNSSDKRNGFIDIQDLQVNCEGDLNPVHPEDLSGREFVIYQYGIHILQLLKSHTNIEDLYLHVASSLPSNNYQGNAFAHSFFYLRSENKLFVPQEYLQSVGSFTLLLVHCISHILSGGFGDDSNPFFLRTFYQAIKVCFTEGFFTRYELSFLSQSTNVSSTNDSILTKEDYLKENQNFISQFISMKFTPSDGHTCYKERTDEMLSMCEVEAIIKGKLAIKKREFFIDNLKKTTRTIMKQEDSQDGMTMEQLHGALDQLNTELIAILEKEVESQKNQNNSVGQCCYLNALFLEKKCLIKKIENLEKQITLLSNIM